MPLAVYAAARSFCFTAFTSGVSGLRAFFTRPAAPPGGVAAVVLDAPLDLPPPAATTFFFFFLGDRLRGVTFGAPVRPNHSTNSSISTSPPPSSSTVLNTSRRSKSDTSVTLIFASRRRALRNSSNSSDPLLSRS